MELAAEKKYGEVRFEITGRMFQVGEWESHNLLLEHIFSRILMQVSCVQWVVPCFMHRLSYFFRLQTIDVNTGTTLSSCNHAAFKIENNSNSMRTVLMLPLYIYPQRAFTTKWTVWPAPTPVYTGHGRTTSTTGFAGTLTKARKVSPHSISSFPIDCASNHSRLEITLSNFIAFLIFIRR